MERKYACDVVIDLEFTPVPKGRRKVALGEATNWCGIANERASAHRALYDAQVTAELFRMMASGDLAAQREAISGQVSAPESVQVATSSIGDHCGGLATLLETLRTQEAGA